MQKKDADNVVEKLLNVFTDCLDEYKDADMGDLTYVIFQFFTVSSASLGITYDEWMKIITSKHIKQNFEFICEKAQKINQLFGDKDED